MTGPLGQYAFEIVGVWFLVIIACSFLCCAVRRKRPELPQTEEEVFEETIDVIEACTPPVIRSSHYYLGQMTPR